MEVFVYEHVSSGGYAGRKLPAWLAEGYSMLAAFLEDFKRLGCKTVTLLDARLKPEGLKADRVRFVKSSLEVEGLIEDFASKADATLIIAPEHGGILPRLLRLAERAGSATLNAPSSLLEGLGKAEILERLKVEGVSMPEALTLDSPEDLRLKAWKSFPAVVKPSLGVGCLGLTLIRNPSQLGKAVEYAWKASPSKILVQKFVEGLHGSVSLLANGSQARILSVNLQLVRLSEKPEASEYLGGLTPLSLWNPEALSFEALKACRALGGLKGFVGVDFVEADGKPWIIEVNPRPSTSYLGLRKVLRVNPACLLLEACLEGRLPEDLEVRGFSAYFKNGFQPSDGSLEVFSPGEGKALVVGWDESLEALLLRVEEFEVGRLLSSALKASPLQRLRRLEERLRAKGVNYRLIKLKGKAITSADVVKQAAGSVKPDEICKTILLRGERGFYAALTLGWRRISLSRVRRLIGEKVRLATLDELERLGLKPGAICPLTVKVPLIVDEEVLSKQKINFSSGLEDYGLEMSPQSLPKLAAPTCVRASISEQK